MIKYIHPEDEMYKTGEIIFSGDKEKAIEYYFSSGKFVADKLASFIRAEGLEPNDMSVLDFACGYGRITRHLVDNFADVCVADLEFEMLRFQKEHLSVEGFLSNVDINRVLWPRRTFDVVFSFSLFTHLNPNIWEEWFWSVLECVKPGGYFIFSTRGVDFAMRTTNDDITEQTVQHFKEKNETNGRLDPKIYGMITLAKEFVDDVISASADKVERVEYFKGGDFDQYQDMHVLKRV